MEKQLLSELLNRQTPITAADLAHLINRTERTVRNYLKKIECDYKQYNIKIIRKSNVGIYLNIDDKSRAELKDSIEGKISGDTHENGFYFKYRQLYILKTLLEGKFSYTIQLFADELYCSKSTIVNDLECVQAWLDKYNLILKRKQNKGLWIEGNENDYRKALNSMFAETIKNEPGSNLIDEDIEKLDYRIDVLNYKKIKNMFPKVDFYAIQSIIQEAEKKLGFYFTDQAFLNLTTHIIIAIERVKNDKALTKNENWVENLKNEHEFSIAKWIVQQLSDKFKISFPDEEIGYIALHLLGAKVQGNYDAAQCSTIIENEDEEYVSTAKDIIAMSSEILNVDLREDKELLSRLVLHLRPAVMRMKYNLKLVNPMLERIKQEYTSIFGAAWACNSIFERKLGITVNEDEVGYIALHLALSYEKYKSKIKTVIVCSSGIGTSQLVANEITKRYENLEITHIIPLNLLTQKIEDESDLIITTVRGLKKSEKILYISAMVDENDFINIDNAIKKIRFSVKNTCNNASKQKEYCIQQNSIFENQLCFLDSKIKDFVQAITYYGKLMESKGYAKNGFYKNILEREKKGSTYIGKGIAIPHAEGIYVNESRVCIVKFEEPVTWQGNKLDFIFILCLKFNDIDKTKGFFKTFYSILNDDEALMKIKNSKNKNDIINIFIEGGKQ